MSAATPQSFGRVNLALREHAKKAGLIPGSARWRAYVLGTISVQKAKAKKKSMESTTYAAGGEEAAKKPAM